MPKRASDAPMGNSEKKRKLLSLSIAQKVELLQKLDHGVPMRHLNEKYGVGTTTIYDLKKQKDKLLKFYTDSDDPKIMKNRKTLHRAKNEDLDRVLIEWIRQRRPERMPLTGLMVMKQAKIYHEELNIDGECEYSEGWLQKFKKCHGIKYLKICGEKASADHEIAENYIDEFAKIISDENLSPEQIYNADETALYWHYIPRKTLTTADERAPTGVKDAKDRLTVLGCANAAGTHKLNLAVIGKSRRPRCLKGVHNLPVHYYANKKAWVTRELFSDWFNNHFVPSARAHCREAGLEANCKILLFLDNCSAHPPAELLVKSLSSESVNKLEEADIEEVLNIDNDAPVVHSLSDGEIAEMVLNKDKHEDSSDDDDDDDEIVNTCEKVSIDDVMTLEEAFKKAICPSVESSLESPAPGPSSDLRLLLDDDDDNTDVSSS
ncbi:jerky protein homolog [Homarus americanus]|uniref:jerky protein homolog n=1 Tax=Homarus americanus TaxID=6706 RepID=UPI001C493008|nr:jerky protein homolog [Homarus americanus]